MKGNIRIELKDVNNFDKVEAVEVDNFIGKLAKKLMFRVGASAITRYAFRNGVDCTTMNVVYCFDKLSLTDNKESVSDDELLLPGNEIGWANYEEYVGTDQTRGTINSNETEWSNKQLKLVFDFGTDKANGTFQTIGFRANTPRYNHDIRGGALADVDAFTYDGQNIYAYKSKHIFKLNADTLEVIEDIEVPNISDVNGICHLNGRFVVSVREYDYWKIYELNQETNEWELKLNHYYNRYYHYGFCTDGNYFYSCTSSYNYVYRVPVDFSTDSEYKNINITNLEMEKNFNDFHIINGQFVYYNNGIVYGLDVEDFYNDIYTETRLAENVDIGSIQGAPIVLNNKLIGLVSGLDYYGMFESYSDSGYALGEGFNTGISNVLCHIPQGAADLGTCVVLPAAVTKNETQTMKVTYTFTFND